MRIKKAEYIKDYKIKLFFSDGVNKIVDFAPILTNKRKLFVPLSDLEYFKNFHVDEITICWPNELDFAPEYLYEMGVEVKKEVKKTSRRHIPKKSSSGGHSKASIAAKSR